MLRSLLDLAGAAETLGGYSGMPRPLNGPSRRRGHGHTVFLQPWCSEGEQVVSFGFTSPAIDVQTM